MNIQKKRLLNSQQDNIRPQRDTEINEKISDEKYQNNKIDDKNLMKRSDQYN